MSLSTCVKRGCGRTSGSGRRGGGKRPKTCIFLLSSLLICFRFRRHGSLYKFTYLLIHGVPYYERWSVPERSLDGKVFACRWPPLTVSSVSSRRRWTDWWQVNMPLASRAHISTAPYPSPRSSRGCILQGGRLVDCLVCLSVSTCLTYRMTRYAAVN